MLKDRTRIYILITTFLIVLSQILTVTGASPNIVFDTDPDIELISDIILREDSELGGRMMDEGRPMPYFIEGDGNIINPLDRIYPNDKNAVYLFEGEQVIFDIETYVGVDIRHRFGDAYLTISYEISEERGDYVASCWLTNKDREEEGILDFKCVFEVGSQEDMYGEYVLESVVSTFEPNGEIYESIYIGSFFLNPIIGCSYDSDCGEDSVIGEPFCIDRNLYQDNKIYSCISPWPPETTCSLTINPILIEECELGCSNGECIEEASIKLINDVLLINDLIEGDGEIISPLRTHLFEGEKISFYVQVSPHEEITDIGGVYVTVNNQPEVWCIPDEIIDDKYQNYLCILTIETPESMHGNSLIKTEVETAYGEHAEIEIGSWFLNPVIDIDFNNPLITFSQVFPGKKVYSELVIIMNNVEEGSNVDLSMFITGEHLSNLPNLSYYAENGHYSTANDPRADSEGYISVEDGSVFSTLFYGEKEIIQTSEVIWIPNKPILYPENTLQHDREMILKFRFDVPESYVLEDFDIGNIFIWGAADNGWGPSVGHILNFDLIIMEDTTPPEAIIKYNFEDNDVEVIGVDNYDLDVDITYTERIYFGRKIKIRDYILTDDSGNKLETRISYANFENYLFLKIIRLNYNGEPINPGYNYLSVISKKKGDIRQSLYLLGIGRIDAVFNHKIDKTTIRITNGRNSSKIVKDGLVLIDLMTDKGKLDYSV